MDARYVIGCDGARSTVREQAGIAFEGRAYPQTFVLADLEVDGIEPDAAHAFISSRGIVFSFPLMWPATWRMLTMRPRTNPTPVEWPVSLSEVQALADSYASIPERLHDPVWMTNFRLHNRGAVRYRAGRVFLAGDAAHIHSPAGAQGMNTGIQGAVNLGWKLALVAAGAAEPALLDSYEPERAPVGRLVLASPTARSPSPPQPIRWSASPRTQLVPLLAPLALRVQPGRRYGFRLVSQLGIRYRNSPLSTEGADAPRDGPRAGDRVPDAPVTQNGQSTTLHRALASPGFHVLLCGPVAAWPDAAFTGPANVHRLTADRGDPEALFDHTGVALGRLGVAGHVAAHYLVRPDGHIAYRSGADLTGLRAYLARWLVRPTLS